MKRLLIVVFAFIASVTLFAQDLESVTNIYNEGAMALNDGDKQKALQCFEQALEQAELLGAEAEEVAYNCKKSIPIIIMSIGKEQASAKDISGAIATLNKAAEKGREYAQNEVVEEVEILIPQLYMQEGNLFLNNKQFKEAADSYAKVVELNPTDGNAYLRLGQAASRADNEEQAIEALSKAIELGQKNASKELGNIYLRSANAALKGKDYTTAYELSLKSIEVFASPQAMNMAGTAAIKLKKYPEAIAQLEAFLEASPNAKSAPQVKYQLATVYESVGDKEKACLNYKAIVGHPQFKEYATHKINVELKCK